MVGLNKQLHHHKHHYHKIEEEHYHIQLYVHLIKQVKNIIHFNNQNINQIDHILYNIYWKNLVICGHQKWQVGVIKIHIKYMVQYYLNNFIQQN